MPTSSFGPYAFVLLSSFTMACGPNVDGAPQDGGEPAAADAGEYDAGTPPPDGGAPSDSGPNVDLRAAAQARVQDAVNTSSFPDAVLLLGDSDGIHFTFAKGDYLPSTVVQTFSAQKWVAATVLLRELDAAGIGLDTPLFEYPSPLAFAVPADPRGAVNARGLLSFTSGFETSPLCVAVPAGPLATCANSISDGTFAAEARFNYGTYHMTLLAHALGNASATHYGDQFDRFRTSTGLFSTAFYSSAEKPVGFESSALDYATYLQSHLKGELLSAFLTNEMFADQSGAAEVLFSPADELEGRWVYGFGNWQRCDDDSPCRGDRNSAGARGFFPWLDLDDDHFGVLVVRGAIGDYAVSAAIYEAIRDDVAMIAHAP